MGLICFKIHKHIMNQEIVFFLQDWGYTLQLKLNNLYVKDIPRVIKTDIYEENVTYVFLIHGSVEDCHLRKTYNAPFLIPATCHQVKTKVIQVFESTYSMSTVLVTGKMSQ